nr:keratin, type II cytoskeletal 3-like [Penaeus vannamei]
MNKCVSSSHSLTDTTTAGNMSLRTFVKVAAVMAVACVVTADPEAAPGGGYGGSFGGGRPGGLGGGSVGFGRPGFSGSSFGHSGVGGGSFGHGGLGGGSFGHSGVGGGSFGGSFGGRPSAFWPPILRTTVLRPPSFGQSNSPSAPILRTTVLRQPILRPPILRPVVWPLDNTGHRRTFTQKHQDISIHTFTGMTSTEHLCRLTCVFASRGSRWHS